MFGFRPLFGIKKTQAESSTVAPDESLSHETVLGKLVNDRKHDCDTHLDAAFYQIKSHSSNDMQQYMFFSMTSKACIAAQVAKPSKLDPSKKVELYSEFLMFADSEISLRARLSSDNTSELETQKLLQKYSATRWMTSVAEKAPTSEELAESKRESQRHRQMVDLRQVLGISLDGQPTGVDKAKLLNWLMSSPPDPDLWHDIAQRTDPDGSNDIYAWIVSQSDCDCATASTIFHASNAFERLELLCPVETENVRKDHRVELQTILKILNRANANDFKSNKFELAHNGYEEPIQTYLGIAKKLEEISNATIHIPMSLFEFRKGVKTNSSYYWNDFSTLADKIKSSK